MILVTGATGLLGFHLVQHLQATRKEEQLRVLVRKQEHADFFSSLQIEAVLGDILDVDSLTEAFQKVDYVFHCAAVVSFSPKDERNMLHVNVTGTANIVNACIQYGVKKLCHVSSVAALGPGKKGVVDETCMWEEGADSSYYGYTKHLSELEAWRGHAEGLEVVIVNPSVILGPVKDWDQSSMKLFKYVKDGNSYYTAGRNNMVDVRDVVHIMNSLMFSDISGERFIVAGDAIPYKILFETIAQGLGVPAPHKKASPWMITLMWRIEQIKTIFGYTPLITKETIKVAKRQHQYTSEKIQQKLGVTFYPLKETVVWVCKELKSPSNLI